MLNCSLLHNQSVPTGALQKYINIVKDQFLSPDLSVDKAYEIIIGQLRFQHDSATTQLFSIGGKLYNAFERALIQLNEEKIPTRLVNLGQIPLARAALLSSLEYVQVFEAPVWAGAQKNDESPLKYYTLKQLGASNQEAIVPEILKDSHRLETDIGSATRLQVLQEALYTLESVSLKFVMEAARSLDLDASTMRDILRYASARSAASIAKDEDDYGSDLTLMRSKLSIFTALTLSLQNSSPSPITAAARSTIYRWENVEISHHSSDAPGSPTVWDFSDKSQYQSHQREKLVIVGLGVMGIGMALSAQKVYDVRGCDSNPERLAEADAQGLPTTPNLTSALIDVDCVLFVVQTTQEIMSILDQASDALTVRRKPLTIIVHSTISSKSAVMIQTRLFNLNKRIQYIEAPVSGGPARAYRGELLVIVGGQEPTLDHWLPLFAHISSRLYYAGSTGNAAKMKALHQVAAATNHLASFEVICAGLEAGFDGQFLYEVLVKFAYNQHLTDRIPKLLSGDLTPHAQLVTWLQDLAIARDQLQAGNVDTSLVDIALSLFKQAGEKGSVFDSDVSVIKCWPRCSEKVI